MRNAQLHYQATPTFIKQNSQYSSNVDQEFNFEEELMDEFAGACFVPALMAAKEKNETQKTNGQNLRSVMNSIQNLENCIIERKTKQKEGFQNEKKSSIFETFEDNSPQRKSGGKSRYTSGCVSSRFEENIQDHLFKKEKRIKDLKEELENVEMKECTFSPNTHTKLKKEKTPKRNLKEFLKNQTEYMNKVEKKKEDLKKETEQNKKADECFRPKINKSASNTYKSKKPAYERLYELNETRILKNSLNQQERIKEEQKERVDHSKLSTHRSKRNIPTPSLLYEDAERRHQVAKSIEKAKNCMERMDSSEIFKNKNSEKYVAKKFFKEFCQVLENLDLLSNEDDEEWKEQDTKMNKASCKKEFSQKEFNTIFRELGFMGFNEASENDLACEERNLASEAYQILEQYGVNAENMCAFSLAILGVFQINMEEFYENRQEPREENLHFDEKEGRKLQKYFNLFYRNRLSCKTQPQSPYVSSHHNSVSPSSPYISPRHSKNTNNLASKYRSKMVERANQRFLSHNIDIHLPPETMLAHEDLLVIDSLGRNLDLKKMKEEKDTFLDEECTFYPKVNGSRVINGCQTDRGMEKSMELYQFVKSKRSISREKNTCQTERSNQSIFDKSKSIKKECEDVSVGKKSERKVIKKTKENKVSTKKSEEYFKSTPKDVDKAVARMIEGRKLREAKNNFLARGELKPKTPSKQSNLIQNQHLPFSSSIAQNEPFLVIDVNMGDETQQIEFFSGDEKRVKSIVEDFCIDFDVDDDCKKELFDMVQLEIWKYKMTEG